MSSPDSATPPAEGIPESQQVSASSRRPTGVTVFAILSILFGIIGLLGAIGSLLMFLLQRLDQHRPQVQCRILVSTSVAYRVFYLTILGLGIVFAAILLICRDRSLKMSIGSPNAGDHLRSLFDPCHDRSPMSSNIFSCMRRCWGRWVNKRKSSKSSRLSSCASLSSPQFSR